LKNLNVEKTKKVARLLLTLGEEKAAEVLSHLEPQYIEPVILELSKIQKITDDEKQEVLTSFKAEVDKIKDVSYAGIDSAFDFLKKVVGETRAKEKIDKLQNSHEFLDFTVFDNYPLKNILQVLEEELPQTIAIFLSKLKPKLAASILSQIDDNKKTQTAIRIAKLTSVTPEILLALYKSIVEKLEKLSSEHYDEVDGKSKINEILKNLDLESQENIFKALAKDDPQLSEQLKQNLIKFDDLLNLNEKEIRKIFEEVPDNLVWAKALKGAGQNLMRQILGSISINRSADITDEMNLLKSLPFEEIEIQRRYIMSVATNLHHSGVIDL